MYMCWIGLVLYEINWVDWGGVRWGVIYMYVIV